MKNFKCACGRKQSYAPATKRGGITEKEAELVGWRKINGEWNCPFCTGNMDNLNKIFNKAEKIDWKNDMVCSECEKQGLKSWVFIENISRTLPYCPPHHYDKTGRWRSHDRNITITEYSCTEGHSWIEKTIVSYCCGWPNGISDGLILPCSICHRQVFFDYLVDDEFWENVAPSKYHRDAICLPCLDKLATKNGLNIASHLESIQFTGIGKTIVLLLSKVYYYKKKEADKSSQN